MRSSTIPFDPLRRRSNLLVCPPLSQQQRSASFSSSASSAAARPNRRPVRSRGVPPVTFPPPSSSSPPVPLLSTIPPHILRPPYARPPFAPPPNLFAAETDPASSSDPMMMMLWPRSQEELQQLRRVCRQAKRLLRFACRWARERGEGSTTAALDAAVREAIVVGEGGAAAAAAYPSPLGYKGFPRAICTSVNEVACHGVPFEGRRLRRGDLVHIDLTIYAEGTEEGDETKKKRRRSNEAVEEEERRGWHGDCSRTVVVGGEYLDEQSRELVEANEEALRKAVAAVRPGMRANAIGEIIAGVAEEHGFSIVKEVCGHGIGRHFHAPPTIPHFRTDMSSSVILHPGMVFTIEPIFCEGSGEVWLCEDGWSIATKDGGWSAAAEDTILVTEDGAEVLTSCEEE